MEIMMAVKGKGTARRSWRAVGRGTANDTSVRRRDASVSDFTAGLARSEAKGEELRC